MVDKKGQQMTLGTIIAIVLGIAVLVFLIFGFSQGWTSLWDQVTVGTSGSNVELKIADCDNDCDAGEKSSWCNEKKSLRFFDDEGEIMKVSGTCDDFYEGEIAEDNVDLPSGLGFKSCPTVMPC